MTPREIAAVLDSHPDLTHFGFGVFDPHRKTPEQREAERVTERWKLLKAADECSIAEQWLCEVATQRKTLNHRYTSYGLKHRVESYHRPRKYVSNGSFICAAIHLGFNVKRCDPWSPNAFLNISLKRPYRRPRSAW